MYNTWQLSWQQGNHGNSQDKGQYTPHIDVGGEAERLSVRLSTLIGILQRAANDVEDLCVHMFTVTLKSSVSSTQEAAGGSVVCTSSDVALFLCLSSGQISEFSLREDKEGKKETTCETRTDEVKPKCQT